MELGANDCVVNCSRNITSHHRLVQQLRYRRRCHSHNQCHCYHRQHRHHNDLYRSIVSRKLAGSAMMTMTNSVIAINIIVIFTVASPTAIVVTITINHHRHRNHHHHHHHQQQHHHHHHHNHNRNHQHQTILTVTSTVPHLPVALTTATTTAATSSGASPSMVTRPVLQRWDCVPCARWYTPTCPLCTVDRNRTDTLHANSSRHTYQQPAVV